MSTQPDGPRPVPQEHHLEVRRTARYFTLGPAPATAGDVWIVLHGYSQLARRFLRHFAPLDNGTRALIAPEALNRYYSEYAPGFHRADARVGGTWMTREDRLTDMADNVRYLDQLYHTLLRPTLDAGAHPGGYPPAIAERVVLLGFSQGAATAARWAALGTARFRRVILWGGFVPAELARGPGLFPGAGLTLVCGRGDHYATPNAAQAEVEALRAAGLEPRVHWHEGGHQLDPATLERVAAES